MSVAMLMPLMGLEELPSKPADARGHGDEQKSEDDDENSGEQIVIPAGFPRPESDER